MVVIVLSQVKAHALPVLASLLTKWIRVGDEELQETIIDILEHLIQACDNALGAVAKQPNIIASMMFALDQLTNHPQRLFKLLRCLARIGMCATAADVLEREGAIKRFVR